MKNYILFQKVNVVEPLVFLVLTNLLSKFNLDSKGESILKVTTRLIEVKETIVQVMRHFYLVG